MPQKLKLSKNPAIFERQQSCRRRWVRTVSYARVSGRQQDDHLATEAHPDLRLSAASLINDIEFNDLDEIDKWMEARVVTDDQAS